MLDGFKRSWRALRRAPAGRRFREYHRWSETHTSASAGMRLVRWMLALVALVIGALLVVLPGPAVLFFGIAGMLLATDSLLVARSLDWSERVVCAGWKRLRRRRRERPPTAGRARARTDGGNRNRRATTPEK